MRKQVFLLLAILITIPVSLRAHPDVIDSVVISGFPLGGQKIPDTLGQAANPKLRDFMNEARYNSDAFIEIIAYADATDHVNPHKNIGPAVDYGWAFQRAQFISNKLFGYGLNESKLLKTLPLRSHEKGPEHRKVVVRLIRFNWATEDEVDNLREDVERLKQESQIVPADTVEVKTVTQFGMFIGPGFSYGPYDEPILSVIGGVNLYWLSFDLEGGYSSSTNTLRIGKQDFETRARYVAAHAIFFPDNWSVGLVGGYERHEDLITTIGDRWKKYETFAFGFCYRNYSLPTFKLIWLPGNEDRIDKTTINIRYDQFRVSVFYLF